MEVRGPAAGIQRQGLAITGDGVLILADIGERVAEVETYIRRGNALLQELPIAIDGLARALQILQDRSKIAGRAFEPRLQLQRLAVAADRALVVLALHADVAQIVESLRMI